MLFSVIVTEPSSARLLPAHALIRIALYANAAIDRFELVGGDIQSGRHGFEQLRERVQRRLASRRAYAGDRGRAAGRTRGRVLIVSDVYLDGFEGQAILSAVTCATIVRVPVPRP